MADEDEIDVLGEFDLETLFTKEDERLICYDGMDIPSQWLLDTTAQPCWYPENKPAAQTDDLTALSASWSEHNEHAWTANEKDLLDRGLSLFGRSWPRLAQYVGTKTVHQVKSFVNSQSPSSFSELGALGFTEIIDDFQIPATMEEVIAVVSTAQPTVGARSTARLKAKRGRPLSSSKTQPQQHQPQTPRQRGPAKGSKRGPKPKTRPPPGMESRPRGRPPKHAGTIARCAIRGEEVVRMVNTCDQDAEVDIESDSEDVRTEHPADRVSEVTAVPGDVNSGTEEAAAEADLLTFEDDSFVREEEVPLEETDDSSQRPAAYQNGWSADDDGPPTDSAEGNTDNEERPERYETSTDLQRQLTDQQQQRIKTHQAILERIYDIPPPTQETNPDPNEAGDVERQVHAEFFEGRATKTPGRYLKIRNHIVECWRLSKPAYISKTSVRSGLKNCGDVNCVGRIHAFLEQTGAINYGCEQARYERPLFAPSPYDLPPAAPPPSAASSAGGKSRLSRKPRPHHEGGGGLFASQQHGGYTITHRADGTTQTHVVPEQPAVKKARQGGGGGTVSGQPIQLIACKKFDETNLASHCVELDVSALIVMDVHAHASHCEVIGLLGGTIHDTTLTVTRTVPCRAASSRVHCDMCPVSQTEASEQLLSEGWDVVGWYHSHPTFSPNPSLQDVTTQRNMQRFFRDRPFLGIILSPHTIASTYRCIVVVMGEGDGADDNLTPYRHNVRLVAQQTDAAQLTRHLTAVFHRLSEHNRFLEEVTPGMTYLDKCVGSVMHHLERLPQLTPRDRQTIGGVIRQLAQDYAS